MNPAASFHLGALAGMLALAAVASPSAGAALVFLQAEAEVGTVSGQADVTAGRDTVPTSAPRAVLELVPP